MSEISFSRLIRVSPLVCAAGLYCLSSAAGADDRPVRFAVDVRPILASKCWSCHGPDEQTRKGELRLDIRKHAQSVLLSETGAQPPLLKRITAADPELRMPPVAAKKSLNSEEIRILTLWLQQGAP